MTKLAMTIGMVEKVAIASVGDNGACSNGGSEKNECGSTERIGNGARGSSKTGSLCNGGR